MLWDWLLGDRIILWFEFETKYLTNRTAKILRFMKISIPLHPWVVMMRLSNGNCITHLPHPLPLRPWRLQENAPFLRWSRMGEGEGQQLRPLCGYRVQEENGGVLPWGLRVQEVRIWKKQQNSCGEGKKSYFCSVIQRNSQKGRQPLWPSRSFRASN